MNGQNVLRKVCRWFFLEVEKNYRTTWFGKCNVGWNKLKSFWPEEQINWPTVYPVMMSEGITSVYVIDGVIDPALSWGGVDGVFFLLCFFYPHYSCFFTAIMNPRNLSEKPKSFTFDYSYWSHNEVKISNVQKNLFIINSNSTVLDRVGNNWLHGCRSRWSAG